MPPPKVAVIGLDCATPKFLWGRDAFHLPNIAALFERSAYGVLESCHPPITVPAWSAMTTGVDPGALGCYGFRNRADRSYAPMRVSTGNDVGAPRVWDILGESGRETIVLGVPQTFPPRSINGCLVSGMLTPDTSVPYTHPESLAAELDEHCGGYTIDVPNFRNAPPAQLVSSLGGLLLNRFRIAEYLLTNKPWDFFMMVEIGLDRLHHAFWRYADSAHPKHVPDHPYGAAFRRYYEQLDGEIGRILSLLPTETAVLLVSDHGAQPIFGGIRINQWLIDEGYLVLKSPPAESHALEWDEIDWAKTRAWSSGGYYARIFINQKGREPEGIVGEPEALRRELAEKLKRIPDSNGKGIDTQVHFPEDIYAEAKGVPPDLLVYFGGLRYRAVGTVAADSIYADENDTGPDDANHAFGGMYALSAPGVVPGESNATSIMDITPTILDICGVPCPAEMRGKSLLGG